MKITMKKTYIAPEALVEQMTTEFLMAASPINISIDEGITIDDLGDVAVKESLFTSLME